VTAQRLLLPFASQMLLCGYQNALYRAHWGYSHYGIDISARQAGADERVLASACGKVLAVGHDNSLGWGLAVLYPDCAGPDGTIKSLVARYLHLQSVKVAAGDLVLPWTILGTEGKEGTTDYHLHLELDTDIEWPVHTPQVARGHTFWKKGSDTTVDPSLWLHAAGGRTAVEPTYNPAWLNPQDLAFSQAPSAQSLQEKLVALAHDIIDGLEAV